MERLTSEARYGEDKFIQVNGYMIHYVETGKGKPIVFVQGSYATYRLWNRVVPLLENDLHLITLDYLGVGDSDKPRSGFEYTIQEQSAVIARFIEELGFGRVNLVGQSYGGAVVMHLAAHRPDLIDAVVSIEGGIVMPEKMGMFDATKYIFSWPLGFLTIGLLKTGLLDRLVVRAIAGKWYPETSPDDREVLLEQVRSGRKGATRYAWHGISVSPWTCEHYEDLAKSMTVPVLYIHGGRSDFRNLADANVTFLEENIPNARIVGFDDGIHDMELQKPREVAALIQEFFGEEHVP